MAKAEPLQKHRPLAFLLITASIYKSACIYTQIQFQCSLSAQEMTIFYNRHCSKPIQGATQVWMCLDISCF